MEPCLGASNSSYPLKNVGDLLFKLFHEERAYPKESIKTSIPFQINLKDRIFSLNLPLLVETENLPALIVYYKPSLHGLFSFEREALALGRVFSLPPPIYVLLTNLVNFILIDVESGKSKSGTSEVIPSFKDLVTMIKKRAELKRNEIFGYKLENEKKILTLYLSSG